MQEMLLQSAASSDGIPVKLNVVSVDSNELASASTLFKWILSPPRFQWRICGCYDNDLRVNWAA